MRIATLIFFVAACLAMAAPAAAASYQINLPTKIEDAGSPIHITLCLAGRNNDIGNGGYNVNFVNTAPKAATAIEFVFRMRDAFDKVLGYQPAMRQGTFAPNVQQGHDLYLSTAGAGGAWDAPLIEDGTAEVDCAVGRVRFVDGSEWESQDWVKEQQSAAVGDVYLLDVLGQP
jgi:hypothetical protein